MAGLGLVYNNRADVVFLINGIPVAVAETKAAEKCKDHRATAPEEIESLHDPIKEEAKGAAAPITFFHARKDC